MAGKIVKKNFKATAVSPANIAFIKYWGKADSKRNIPLNDSVSMNLSGCLTETTVEFSEKLKTDKFILNGKAEKKEKLLKVISLLNMVRKLAKVKWKARVTSKNMFPTGQGIASSASGFSALAVAACGALGLSLSNKRMSILARSSASGSACRSVVDGFAYWKKGSKKRESFATQLAPVGYWKIVDLVAVVKGGEVTSTTHGHELALSSEFLKKRLANVEERIKKMKRAFLDRDLKLFGELVEEESMEFNAIQITSKPWFLPWNGGSVEVMRALRRWREEGSLAYGTNDAGPHIHVICKEKEAGKILKKLKTLKVVDRVLVNKPTSGARIVK